MTLDRDERQTRLEWMIDEFQQARRRRLTHANVRTVESHVEPDGNAPPCSNALTAAAAAASADLPGMNGDTRLRLVWRGGRATRGSHSSDYRIRDAEPEKVNETVDCGR
jgi:hypothetical protein